MDNEPKEIILKTSRMYFLGNYIIAVLIIILLLLLYFIFHLKFTLFPKTLSDMTSTLILLGVAGIAAAMIEQPEWERFRTHFIVTMNEVIKQEGILTKHRLILPYGTVADISIRKSMFGRMLNYGDLTVSSFKTDSDIVMKGIRNPESIHTMIQNRVNLIREGQMTFFGKDEKEDKSEESKE